MKKVFFITLAIIATACSTIATPTAVENEAAQQRTIWEGAGISHYKFEIHLSCFCVFRDEMPLTVEVKDGEVVSITTVKGDAITAGDPDYEFFVSYGTFEGLFTRIEGALTDEEAGDVVVTYDPTYGFPVDASIDYIEMAADDEMYFTVSGFEQLP